jgi:hypothetical protein
MLDPQTERSLRPKVPNDLLNDQMITLPSRSAVHFKVTVNNSILLPVRTLNPSERKPSSTGHRIPTLNLEQVPLKPHPDTSADDWLDRILRNATDPFCRCARYDPRHHRDPGIFRHTYISYDQGTVEFAADAQNPQPVRSIPSHQIRDIYDKPIIVMGVPTNEATCDVKRGRIHHPPPGAFGEPVKGLSCTMRKARRYIQ